MEQGAEKVLVLFLAVDLLRSWMVQLRLLYWVSYGVDLLGEKVFVPFISFGFAFVGPGSNTWIFRQRGPLLFERPVVTFHIFRRLVLNF